jgi:hypothetical protein
MVKILLCQITILRLQADAKSTPLTYFFPFVEKLLTQRIINSDKKDNGTVLNFTAIIGPWQHIGGDILYVSSKYAPKRDNIPPYSMDMDINGMDTRHSRTQSTISRILI